MVVVLRGLNQVSPAPLLYSPTKGQAYKDQKHLIVCEYEEEQCGDIHILGDDQK